MNQFAKEIKNHCDKVNVAFIYHEGQDGNYITVSNKANPEEEIHISGYETEQALKQAEWGFPEYSDYLIGFQSHVFESIFESDFKPEGLTVKEIIQKVTDVIDRFLNTGESSNA